MAKKTTAQSKGADPQCLTQPLWPDTAKQLGIGRNAIYEAASRGEIPGLVTIGRKKLVVKEVFRRRLTEGGKAA